MSTPAATLLPPVAGSPFVLSAEHASNAIPDPWSASEADASVLSTHWGWDIGVAVLTRTMARETGSGAVLSTFSRLLCDPNRDPDHPDLVVEEVEGHALSFNRGLTEADRVARAEALHRPYHAAIEGLFQTVLPRRPRPLYLAMHSFTPVWRGERRWMDVGVIFTPDQGELAARAVEAIGALGLKVASNEPYQAGSGMAYALERHGPAFGVPHLELELNQGLIGDPEVAMRLGRELAKVLAPLAQGS